jgi:hypothetical protein
MDIHVGPVQLPPTDLTNRLKSNTEISIIPDKNFTTINYLPEGSVPQTFVLTSK